MAFKVSDAALEAWSECRPEGMTIAVGRLPQLLPQVSVRIPGGLETPERARRLNQVFTPSPAADGSDLPPLFLEWLRPHAGQVHLLRFWTAFSDAATFVASDCNAERVSDVAAVLTSAKAADAAASSVAGVKNLSAEIDALVHAVLVVAEAAAEVGGKQRISSVELVDIVCGAAAMSCVPRFWRTLVESAAGFAEGAEELCMEELAVVLVSWVQEASSWDCERRLELKQRKQRQRALLAQEEKGLPVFIHIYDVSQEQGVQTLNKWLANKRSPVKLGGVFHAGVEVLGLEWSYGFSENDTVPGISCNEPRQHPQHHYRQTVKLRRAKMSQADIGEILSKLLEEYPGDDYDLLRRNCCHFADDFCQRLGSGRIPGWIYRFARIGARLDTAFQVAQGIQERYYGATLPEEAASDSAE